MADIFKNPPLIEAICEFKFADENEWDWTLPGIFYERIKNEFPVKKHEKALVINMENKDGELHRSKEIKSPIEKIVFLREDKSALVQIGHNEFAINHLTPYPGWSIFKKMIKQYFEIYLEYFKPNKIDQISLRYLNRFNNIDVNKFNEYFTVSPKLPMEQPTRNFFLRNELIYEDIRSVLLFSLGTILDQNKKENTVIMDFNLVTRDNEFTQFKEYEGWVESAHDYIEKAFLLCITDQHKITLKGE